MVAVPVLGGGAGEALTRRVEEMVVLVDQGEGGALSGEELGGGFADALGGAGDEDDLAGEFVGVGAYRWEVGARLGEYCCHVGEGRLGTVAEDECPMITCREDATETVRRIYLLCPVPGHRRREVGGRISLYVAVL